MTKIKTAEKISAVFMYFELDYTKIRGTANKNVVPLLYSKLKVYLQNILIFENKWNIIKLPNKNLIVCSPRCVFLFR